MGWFSNDEEVIYTPYSVKLFSDGMPSATKQTVLTSVKSGRNISEDLKINLVNSSSNAVGIRRFYNIGNSKSPYGLPNENKTLYSTAKTSYVSAILTEVFQRKVNIVGINIKSNNNGYQYIVQYGFYNKDDTLEGVTYIWRYSTSENKYPSLNFKSVVNKSPYYPIVPLRTDGIDISKEGTQSYRVMRSMLKALNIDIDDIYESFKPASTASGQGSPEDIFILLSVGIASKKQASIEYLHNFFKTVYAENQVDEPTKHQSDVWDAEKKVSSSPYFTQITISDSNFKQSLRWRYIDIKIKKKNIGKVGHFKLSKTNSLPNLRIKNNKTPEAFSYITNGITIEKQITKTQVEQVTVFGLVCVYTRNNTGQSSAVSIDKAFVEMDDEQAGQSFTVPLRVDVVKSMSRSRVQDLIYESIRMHSNDITINKKKWYQTGFFKVFIFVVSVVVTIIAAPAGVALFSMTMLGLIVTNVIIPMLISAILLPQIAKLLGEEWALAFAVISMFLGLNVDWSSIASIGLEAITVSINVSITAAINAGSMVYQSIAQKNFSKKLNQIKKESELLDDDIEKFYKQQQEDFLDLDAVMNGIESTKYKFMQSNNYVSTKLNEPYIPTYMNKFAQYYNEAQLELDLPN